MAKLIIKTEGAPDRVIQLHLGANRFGRSPENHFPIDHPTVSARHCEISVGDGAPVVRDCGSTNGTFVNGELVKEATLMAGQTLHLGEVELFVETTEVALAIPKFDMPHPTPPVVREDGSLLCPRHKETPATYQCTHCLEVMCDDCVHRLRRKGGKVLKLCPLCSHPCERIGGAAKKKKKTFLGFLQQTVKLPFISKREE
ncbi:MAG TPA: FHA domain-containing protein [Candidatus Acidoferrum sp.]|jgi:pSer/pThr/pTyr-binding forkhead associated (FHA) protein|nr:FHA domain-containing protein [Candidatus Acidoferrum sp.]